MEKLKEENLQLREALGALKRKQPPEESSSNSSWVELGDTPGFGACQKPAMAVVPAICEQTFHGVSPKCS